MPQVDLELFRRACEGDEDAYWRLMLPLRGLIFSVALGMWKNPEKAEDQLHDVLMAARGLIHNLRDPTRLASWLYTMTRNRCIEGMRREDRLRAAVHGSQGRFTPVVPMEELREKEQWLVWMEDALQHLPEPFRIAISLKYMNDYSCQEMAEILDISVPAVKSRLFQARKTLRRMTEALAAREGEHRHGMS